MSVPCSGILELDPRGFGFVRTPSLTLARKPSDPFVPPSLTAGLGLRAGVSLEGEADERQGKSPEVRRIRRVNGMSPELWTRVAEFSAHSAQPAVRDRRPHPPVKDPGRCRRRRAGRSLSRRGRVSSPLASGPRGETATRR